MTRFARAKGSKSSNKREPEEATSWNEMKKNLLNQTNKTTYDKAAELQKHKDTVKSIKENTNATISWSTFDDDSTISNVRKDINSKSNKKKETKIDFNTKNEAIDNEIKIKTKKKKKSKNNSSEDNQIDTNEQNVCEQPHSSHEDNSNKNKKRKNILEQNNTKFSNDEISAKKKKPNEKSQQIDNSKRKPNKNNVVKNDGESKFPKFDKAKYKKEFKERRKPLPEPMSVDINGTLVDIVRYDGFPIKKEDAERLDELKKNLFAKGIPRDEIKKIMKLQRRNAEKALSRAKKHVCFNCRKSGHNLSECPDLNKGEGTGICFKCGSTEHTHFECKVTKKLDFKFANCFICKEQGHISNQCPDNPRGLYPKGGACKLCGDVTHLKRFCPTLPKQDDLTIDSFLEEDSNFNLKNNSNSFQGNNFNKKKHIKF